MRINIERIRFLISLDSRRRIIRDAGIAIEGDRIAFVGKSDELKRHYPNPEFTIDAHRLVATPGLIDAHCHTTEQLLRGLTDGIFAPSAVPKHWLYESSLKGEEAYIASKACLVEAIRNGTTCIVDPGAYHVDEVVKAVEEMGIRAVLSRSLMDIHTGVQPVPEALREGIEKATKAGEEFVRRYNGHADGRIKAWFSLRTERSTSSELARAVKELADRLGVGIVSHVAASHYWIDFHKELFGGLRPIERYAKAGVLGRNLLAIGLNWISDDELELLSRYDVKVVHTPTNAKLALGAFRAKIVEMINRGITVCLGHDSAGEANSGDMLRAMHLTALGHRDARLDPTAMPSELVLEMATLNGARALGMDGEIGSLEPGKKADLVLWDALRFDWVPTYNPVSNLVQSANGDSAHTVLVDGRILLREGRLLVADELRVMEEAEEAGWRVAERSGLLRQLRSSWPIE